jgi:hypothetical protein
MSINTFLALITTALWINVIISITKPVIDAGIIINAITAAITLGVGISGWISIKRQIEAQQKLHDKDIRNKAICISWAITRDLGTILEQLSKVNKYSNLADCKLTIPPMIDRFINELYALEKYNEEKDESIGRYIPYIFNLILTHNREIDNIINSNYMFFSKEKLEKNLTEIERIAKEMIKRLKKFNKSMSKSPEINTQQ